MFFVLFMTEKYSECMGVKVHSFILGLPPRHIGHAPKIYSNMGSKPGEYHKHKI